MPPALPDSLSDSELREGRRKRVEGERRERGREGGREREVKGGGKGGEWLRMHSAFYEICCTSEVDCYSSLSL